MVVSAARNKCKSLVSQGTCQCFCIADYLLLVVFEIFGHYLFETHSFCSYHMHQRTTLHTGEYSRIYLPCMFSLTEYHSPAWASQSLVGGCCYKIRIWYGIWMEPGSYEACNMSHVYHQIGPAVLSDLTESLEIDDPGISACTSNYELWLYLPGYPVHQLIVDIACILADAIKLGSVIPA